MITIGQLARYAGVSTKTVRVYHDRGLLPEPTRDSSGYRRYTGRDAIELIKIRTLAEAGVPLARIRDLRAMPVDEFRTAVEEIDEEIDERVRQLRRTQRHLRRLDSRHIDLLPAEVGRHLDALEHLGFTARWVSLETDLWILVFTTHPEIGLGLLEDEADALADPDLRQIYLDYDRAFDLGPEDPILPRLARRIVDATRARYATEDLPGQRTGSDVPALIQDLVNASSPSWRRLDELIRHGLGL